jgi:deoxyhypusine monooxygenase
MLSSTPLIDVHSVGHILLDKEKPLSKRFRALFVLRNIANDAAVDCIAAAFVDKSVLLKHELAYCLGQMRLYSAIPYLVAVLSDVSQDEMVRHEAGEALGAIGDESTLEILEGYLHDPSAAVCETCQIAIDRIRNQALDGNDAPEGVIFASVDPAPAEKIARDVASLSKDYMNTSLSLYTRYKALFALRNKASEEATLAICKGFKDSSALFRHEVAYVLGQLQHPVSAPYLLDVLKDSNEHPMVRHECAEALGSIATEDCMRELELFLRDDAEVVRESCEVALDIAEFENNDLLSYL